MNLKKLLFSFRQDAATLPESANVAPAKPPADNVIPFPAMQSPLVEPAGLNQSDPGRAGWVQRTPGVLDDPFLREYLADNHFGLGRHNGAHYRSKDAANAGRQHLISRFQNVADRVLQRRLAALDTMRAKQLEIDGVSDVITRQLELACERIQREIDTLRAQIAASAEGEGWIREALQAYEIGFNKGLREAIAFDLAVN